MSQNMKFTREVKPCVVDAKIQIQYLTGSPDTPLHFRAIHLTIKGKAENRWGTVDDLWPWIVAKNEDHGIFFVVNDGGNDDAEITQVRAVFIDGDDIPMPEEWEWHLVPSFLVKRSDTRWHAYWIVTDLPVAEFKRTQQRLAAHYGSDKAIVNPSRVMRLAGTVHRKDPSAPTLMMIDDSNFGQEYAAREVLEGLPDVPVGPSPARPASADTELDMPSNVERARRWLRDAPGAIQGEGGDHHTFTVAAFVRDLGVSEPKALELMSEHWNDRCDPPWSDEELGTKLRNVYAYGQNEIGSKALRPSAEVFANVVTPVTDTPVETTTVGGNGPTWPFINSNTRKPTHRPENTEAFLIWRRVTLSHDTFGGRDNFEDCTTGEAGEIDDATLRRLHEEALRVGYTIPRESFRETILDMAAKNGRHPVRDYLAGLRWDGAPRVSAWLTRYGGAVDNEYTRAVATLFLVAAVRRVRRPGCKFDPMLVLEGPQGNNKSTALRTLAGNNWFTDNLTLGADPKVMIEQTRGKWLVEIPELGGLQNRDVEHVKASLSRQSDMAREAYARFAKEVPRQFILTGTTNPEAGTGYLKDNTGNRRFLPVTVRGFDIAALVQDRDQLWAEAVQIEKTHGELALPPHLWSMAAVEQEARRQIDPLEMRLVDAVQGKVGFVATEEIFALFGLAGSQIAKRSPRHTRMIARVMASQGWRGNRRSSPSHNEQRGYQKGSATTWFVYDQRDGFRADVATPVGAPGTGEIGNSRINPG